LPEVVEPDALPRLSVVERRYIHHVLERLDGNKTRAAEVLGIDRRTLHRKLKRMRERGAMH
jgi:DNA-binding NtrC family response regulator